MSALGASKGRLTARHKTQDSPVYIKAATDPDANTTMWFLTLADGTARILAALMASGENLCG